eukprot:98939-Hanusia_phi.AAC.1
MCTLHYRNLGDLPNTFSGPPCKSIIKDPYAPLSSYPVYRAPPHRGGPELLGEEADLEGDGVEEGPVGCLDRLVDHGWGCAVGREEEELRHLSCLEDLGDVAAAEGAVVGAMAAEGEDCHDHAHVVELDVVGGPPLAVAVHLFVAAVLDREGFYEVVRVGEGPGPEEEELPREDGGGHAVLEAYLHMHKRWIYDGHDAVDQVVFRLCLVEEELDGPHPYSRGQGGRGFQ